MLKKFLHRLFGRPAEPTVPDDLPLSPLTVLAVEPQVCPIDMIDVDNLFFPWLPGMGKAAEPAQPQRIE